MFRRNFSFLPEINVFVTVFAISDGGCFNRKGQTAAWHDHIHRHDFAVGVSFIQIVLIAIEFIVVDVIIIIVVVGIGHHSRGYIEHAQQKSNQLKCVHEA